MKNIFFLLLICVIFLSCLKHPIVPIKKEEYTPPLSSDIKITFSKRPYGEGIPKVGSYVGYDYYLTYNREVIVYTLYERWEYKVVDKFKISENELKELDSLFNAVKFIKYPGFIPDDNATVYWPNDRYRIGYRPTLDSDLKIVSISSINAGKKYYPDGFFKLYELLQKILFQNNSWKI